MKNTWMMAAAATALVLHFALPAQGDENLKDDIAKLPAAVQATIAEQTMGGKITEIEKEDEDGKASYEVEFTKDGKEQEIAIGMDGKFLGVKSDKDEKGEKDGDEDEKPVELKDTPAAVQAAIAEQTQGGEISGIESESDDGVTTYEAKYTLGGKKFEVELGENGKLLEKTEIVGIETLPPAVVKAFKEKYPAAEIKEIESTQKFVYEITATVDGKEKEIKINPAGKLKHDDEEEGEEHEEHEHGKDKD